MRFDASVAEALAKLYSNPVAAVQEILANAVAACKSAAEVHGADPHIRVAIDGRNLTIEDVDSLGMPWRVFKDTYAVAGKSLKVGGDPGSKPGLFGCGSISYTLVSDIMFVETHARTTGERYSVMACDGRGFQTGLKEPTFDWYGTRIRMTIRRSVAMRDVLQRVCDVSDMCGVRIAVECSGLEADDVPDALLDRADQGGGNVAPLAYDDWVDGGVDALPPFRAEIGGTGMSEMIAGHLDALSTYPPPAVAARIRAENKDMEVVAQWVVNSRGFTMNVDRNRTWLAGMPIGDVHADADDGGSGDGCYPRRAGWHSRTMWIHCKSERVYRPTPDRERFPDHTAQRIAADADALIFGRVKCIRPRSLPEYLADGSNRVLEMALPDTEGALDERHKRIARAASCAVAHSYKDGIGGGDGGTTTLWDALYPGAPACHAGAAQKLDGEPLLVVCDRLNRHRDAAIAAHAGASGAQRGPVVVFRPAGGPGIGTRKDDFVDLGCVDADEYVRLHGIAVRPGPDDAEQDYNDDDDDDEGAAAAARKARQRHSASAAKSADLVLHYGDVGEVRRGVLVPRMASMRAAPGALHGTVVRCTAGGEFDMMRRTLAALVCNTTFVTRTSRAVPGTVGFGEYAAAAGRRAYATSGGTMSGSEIAGDGRKAVLVEYNAAGDDDGGKIDRCSGLAALLGDSGDVLFVVGRTDDLSACAAHLWSAGTAAFTVWMLPFYALSYNRADLARREYLGDIAELEDSPMKAADYWLRAAAAGIRPDWKRRARSSAAEMLHSHLAGRALLHKAGIMYGSGSDEDEGEDGGADRTCRAEGEAQCPE